MKGTNFDSTFGIDRTKTIFQNEFPGNIIVPTKTEEAKVLAINHQDIQEKQFFWMNGSILENQRTGIGVIWQLGDGNRNSRKLYLETIKQVFDTELYGVY